MGIIVDNSVDMCIKDKSLTFVKLRDLFGTFSIIWLKIRFSRIGQVLVMSVYEDFFIKFHVK